MVWWGPASAAAVWTLRKSVAGDTMPREWHYCLTRGRRGRGWVGIDGLQQKAGTEESQGPWPLPQDAWGWLLPSCIFGAPSLSLKTQQSWCHSAPQEPFVECGLRHFHPSHPSCYGDPDT